MKIIIKCILIIFIRDIVNSFKQRSKKRKRNEKPKTNEEGIRELQDRLNIEALEDLAVELILKGKEKKGREIIDRICNARYNK